VGPDAVSYGPGLVDAQGKDAQRQAGTNRLLSGLTDAQRSAVSADDSPLCVLAGAGSGKTTVLTRRVARRVLDGSADAEHVHVVTFTRKAAGELRGRLSRLGITDRVWAGTFHAAAYAQLRRHWADHDLRPCAILDDPVRLLRRILDDLGPAPHSGGSTVSAPVSSSAVAAEVHWAQVRLLAPAAYAEVARATGRATPLGPDRIAEAYARYREEKLRRGLVDLDDLLERCATLLETDEEAAASQRWRIRHLFVDEFQDLNPAQWRLLLAWLGGRKDLFVVGDPRQAVYGWNGSDPTLLERLPELLPGTTVLCLDQNHRCSPQIVAAASAVLGPVSDSGASPATFEAVEQLSLADFSPGAQTIAPDSQELGRADGPAPLVVAFDTDESEAVAVSRWLRQAHRPGRRWSQLAVLARTNSRLESVAAALERAGIPHRLSAPTIPTSRTDLGTVRQALRLLRAEPSNRSLRSALGELAVAAEALQASGAHHGATVEAEPSGALPAELARLADEHAAEEPGATVAQFLSWLTANDAASEAGGDDGARRMDAVELMTFHRAKGLEWQAVAVIGLEDGMVPIAYAVTEEAMAEEQRLLYVAMTRACEELWCSWAAGRRVGERSWACGRSRFLEAVEEAVRLSEPVNDDLVARRSRISELRSHLPAAG
jgi:DNA helicase-2/ATP-dependent DNA helicase PcrA